MLHFFQSPGRWFVAFAVSAGIMNLGAYLVTYQGRLELEWVFYAGLAATLCAVLFPYLYVVYVFGSDRYLRSVSDPLSSKFIRICNLNQKVRNKVTASS